jgi:5-methylcytosine-specific restriction endonuclease McrBC GTP-binding regulatory subunit McrB
MTGYVDASPNAYAIVPVGADWTDNRNVIGFVNHLRKDSSGNPVYESTPVLDLLLRALADPSRPYFLILDEMNLSQRRTLFLGFP